MFSLCILYFHWQLSNLSEFFVKKHYIYPVRHKYLMYNPSDHQIHPLSTVFNSLLKVIRSSNTVWNFKKQLIIYLSTPLIPSLNHLCVQFPCYFLLVFFFLSAHNTRHYNAIKQNQITSPHKYNTSGTFSALLNSHTHPRSSWCKLYWSCLTSNTFMALSDEHVANLTPK